MQDILKRLDTMRAQARAGGGERRVAAQHGKGKLTARERLEVLLDEAPMREAMYAFFRAALDWPGAPAEEAVILFSESELWATETGQLATSGGSEDLFTLNRARAAERLEALKSRSVAKDPAEVVQVARELSGYASPSSGPGAVFAGSYQRDGFTIEKHILVGEGDYPIPLLAFVPEGEGPFPAVVYLHPDGKAADAGPGDAIEQLVAQGTLVIAPDLVGLGETGPGDFRGDAYDYEMGVGAYNVWWGANQVGRSLVGIRASDVARVARWAVARPDVGSQVRGIGIGALGPVLLHAAAFEATLSGLALVGSLATYTDIVLNRYYDPGWIHATVPGAIGVYDLPDLVAALASESVFIMNAVDHETRILGADRATAAYAAALGQAVPEGASGVEIDQDVAPDEVAFRLVEWMRLTR